MMRIPALIFGFCLVVSVCNAQGVAPTVTQSNTAPTHRTCASHDKYVEMMGGTKFSEMRTRIEQQTQRWESQSDEQRSNQVNTVVTIPVVFHVLYANGTQNISDAQIMSQLQILNDDFRRLNNDADNTWSQAADSEVEFCLATNDPQGSPTDGILRVSTSVSSFGTSDNVKFSNSGGSDAWPAGSYLNFWVCNVGGGILGYAQFPGGSASTDGVVCDYRYVGNVGTATAPFDMGRTATHEVGHWLNLYHIWGDGNCNQDDQVADTPNSDAANFGCATGHQSCSSTDMVQNYMDYSDDACMNLFTSGQKSRMQALVAPGGFRASLATSDGCAPACTTGCGCTDSTACNYDSDATEDDGSCDFSCQGCTDAEACNYDVDATVDDGSCIGNGTNVTMTILTDNYPGETTWNLQDATGTVVLSGGPYSSTGTIYTSSICLSDGCYSLQILDSANDGLCCAYGSGSYSLAGSDGVVYASGADFDSIDTTEFCIESGEPLEGCTDSTACNYNAIATVNDNSCLLATGCDTCSGATDGSGSIVDGDVDNDGICNADEITGCQDALACNYDADATDEGDCIYPMADFDCDGNALGCAEDINNNGTVEVSDLLILLGDFGCTADCSAADINGDGSVTVADMLLFLSMFGEDC
ncbi:MAG: M43 family zinc metalloprotease [Flavobacteriales bacterium]|nr:M43 family zinc metalloprotease [Flavobacteriales bacterium]